MPSNAHRCWGSHNTGYIFSGQRPSGSVSLGCSAPSPQLCLNWAMLVMLVDAGLGRHIVVGSGLILIGVELAAGLSAYIELTQYITLTDSSLLLPPIFHYTWNPNCTEARHLPSG